MEEGLTSVSEQSSKIWPGLDSDSAPKRSPYRYLSRFVEYDSIKNSKDDCSGIFPMRFVRTLLAAS